jgi:hypothetical protein
MLPASVADEVLAQLGENVHMYIGNKRKTKYKIQSKGKC